MNSPRLPEEQAPPFPPAAEFDPVISGPSAGYQGHNLLQELDGPSRLVRASVQHGQLPTPRLVQPKPATREALNDLHDELDRQVAERTAELLQANAALTKQLIEIARAQRRLAAEHAVARILTESTRLTDAAPKILQAISHSLGWDVGVLWVLDRDHEVLRCIEVWHDAQLDMPVFEQVIRERTFSRGMGLPGRVWASDRPVWIPDLSQDGTVREAPLAATEGLHAAVGFPVRNGVESLGVMEFFSREIRQPDEELLKMMISIGSHISQFMERLKAEKALSRKEAELGLAKTIQQGLVPKALPALAGFEIAGVSHCADETGGDFFDFFPLLDSCQGIAIADASGHGIGPALLITETRAYLRAFALTHEDIGRIVTSVNCCLAEDVGGDRFVTLFLARLDPRKRSLSYTSAGHPPGFVFDPSGRVKTRLHSTGRPLGLFTDGDFPVAPAVLLEPGDLVLLMTDGVIEACAPDGTAFGFQRVIDLVRIYRRDTAAQLVQDLYHGVRAFSHYLPQIDDITVVVIKLQEVPGAPS